MQDHTVTEDEALKLQEDRDNRINKIREDMGQPAKAKAEVEEEAPEDEAEEESEVETPTAEEESEEEESEEESVESDEEEDPQPRNTSAFRTLNQERSKWREERQQLIDQREKEKAEYEAQIADFKKNLPPPQPFVDFAKKQGINDPKQVVEMFDLFKSQMASDFDSKIVDLTTKIETFQAQENGRQEQAAYSESMGKLSDEWKEVLPTIQSEYKPTAEQAEQAFELMSELAHDERYHDKELDYILFKEAQKFEEIFGARKRRTMFSSHGRPAGGDEKTPIKRDGSHESIMAMKKERDRIKSMDVYDKVKDDQI